MSESDVIRHLKITWTDETTTAEVEAIISRATIMIQDLTGCEDDYTEFTGRYADLFLNLCLYLYNGLTEQEFIEAYGESIVIARQMYCDPIDIGDDDE